MPLKLNNTLVVPLASAEPPAHVTENDIILSERLTKVMC